MALQHVSSAEQANHPGFRDGRPLRRDGFSHSPRLVEKAAQTIRKLFSLAGGAFGILAISALPGEIVPDGQWGPQYSIENGSLKVPGIGPDNPLIYDNDWWHDIIDAGFAVAQHKLGRLNLKGLIVTRDMWKGHDQYTLETSTKEFTEFRKLAVDSGLTTTPHFTPGAAARLHRPESGKISDTSITPTPGSNLIIAEAKMASPAKRLVIVVGGAPTTVATALLQDPSIAPNILVLWLAIDQYNANDEWASHVMLMRSAVIHYHFVLRDGLTKEMLNSLPANPLNNKFKNSQLVFDNGVGDGVLLAWLFDHSFITGAEKKNVTNLVGREPTQNMPYGFLHIENQQKRSGAIAQFMIDVLTKPEVWDANYQAPDPKPVDSRQ